MLENYWIPICVGFVVGNFAAQIILIIYNSIQLARYKKQLRKEEETPCTNS